MIEVLDRQMMIIRCDACGATLRVDTNIGEFVKVT